MRAKIRIERRRSPAPSLRLRAGRGETAEGKLTLVNRDKSPLKITDLELNNTEFTAEIRTLEDSQRYELAVRLAAKESDGEFNALLTVVTNKKKLSRIPIAVTATVSSGQGVHR